MNRRFNQDRPNSRFMGHYPFKKGDTFKTNLKGQEVEAIVAMLWKDEVQGRI